MGGELQECGCFDGPWSAQDETFVSIRCAEHYATVPPLEGFILLDRDTVRLNVASYGSWYEKIERKKRQRGTMAASIKSRRR